MAEDSRCQRCDATLAGQAVGELCANCLLKLALEPLLEETLGLEGSPPVPAGSPRVPYFGDYELVEEIARGGMGVVYKARQVSLNRTVALKMILAGDFSSPAMIERFQTEAEAAARLEHPNIVPIFEIGTHEGQHYFSMRFVEGGTLAQKLTRSRRRKEAHEPGGSSNSKAEESNESSHVGCYSSKEAVRLMIKIARAVHHAHQRGIIHRDLKPGNILLDAAGEPHVADFGLAKLLEHDSALTQSATVLGTPAYMAPEQAEGQMKEATTAVDIYSLGAILYELLTGRPPFVGRSSLEVLMQVREREPASPQSIQPELDRDVAVICLKCLEKTPARRYGSAEALADELQRWLAHEPIQARQVTAPERAWKWAQRKPVVAGLAVALHLVAIVGIIGILWQSSRANVEARNARRETKRAESELWNANLNEARALRMAGGSGARVQSSALVQRLIQRPGLTEEQILNLREEAIAHMALVDVALPTNWIPKVSNKLLGWNSSLNLYARDTGSERVDLCEFPSARVIASFSGPSRATFNQAVFSSDDQFLAVRFSNAGGTIRVWKVDTQELLLQTTGAENFRISPDSRTLAVLTTNGVVMHPLSAGSLARHLQPGRPARRVAFSPDSKQVAALPDSRDTVEIWDADSGEVHRSLSISFHPHRVDWHPDGSRLIVGGDRGKLEMRNLLDHSEFDTTSTPLPLTGHVGYIDHLDVAADGSTAVTYAWDSSSRVWDLVSGRPLLREERFILRGISPTADRVVVRRENPPAEFVTPLHLRTGFRTVAWAGEARTSQGVLISPDGRLGVVNCGSTVSGREGDCLLWDFASGLEIGRVKGVWAQFSADSRTLFTFERFAENRVRRYDVSVEALANPSASWTEGSVVYRGRRGENVNTGSMSPDGRTLVIAATDSVIFLDTVENNPNPTRSWRAPAHNVVLSQNGKWAATGRHHFPSVLRAVRDGKVIRSFGSYGHLRFSPDSRWLAVVSPTAVEIHDLESLLPAYSPVTLDASSGATPPVEFSHDSRMFAVPYNRTKVRLYETSTGRKLATLSPPGFGQILGGQALTFSRDGQWLLAAKDDGETVGWNLPVIRAELAKLGLDWQDRQK